MERREDCEEGNVKCEEEDWLKDGDKDECAAEGCSSATDCDIFGS